MSIDIEEILKTLATRYALFSSERDFQEHFSIEILRQHENSHVFTECSPFPLESSVRVDICVIHGDIEYLFELKYKIRNQAVDLSCYDYVKDIRKLEILSERKLTSVGFAIFLTNRSIFWRGSDNKTTDYYPFQIKDGKELSGTLDWQANREKKGKGRQDQITLDGCYRLTWHDYCNSVVDSRHKGTEDLRYLVVKV